MSIGIDKIGFATSQYVLNMADLALARGAEPEKFSKGLMLDATSITPITEDIVTLASDAAADILNDDDKNAIDMVIVAFLFYFITRCRFFSRYFFAYICS